MDEATVDKAIRDRMSEIKRRRIWQRAIKVLKKFGTRDEDVRDYFTKIRIYFDAQVDGHQLSITLRSHGHFHESDVFKIYVDGTLMFQADNNAWPENQDRRALMKIGSDTIVVEYYRDAFWRQILDLRKISRALRPKKATVANKRLNDPKDKGVRDPDLLIKLGVSDSNTSVADTK